MYPVIEGRILFFTISIGNSSVSEVNALKKIKLQKSKGFYYFPFFHFCEIMSAAHSDGKVKSQ